MFQATSPNKNRYIIISQEGPITLMRGERGLRRVSTEYLERNYEIQQVSEAPYLLSKEERQVETLFRAQYLVQQIKDKVNPNKVLRITLKDLCKELGIKSATARRKMRKAGIPWSEENIEKIKKLLK